jgi:hypothetical protein
MQSNRNVIAGDSSDVMYTPCSSRFKHSGHAMVPQVNSMQSTLASSHTSYTDVQTLKHPRGINFDTDKSKCQYFPNGFMCLLQEVDKMNAQARGRFYVYSFLTSSYALSETIKQIW